MGCYAIAAIFGLLCAISTATNPNERRLIHNLMTGLEDMQYLRPGTNATVPLDVTHGFSLIQLIEFDQLYQILTIVGWEFMSWEDRGLMWNASEYDNYKFIVLPPEKIWTPDIVLFNALDQPVAIHDTLAHIKSDGRVTWVTQKKYKATCVTNPEEVSPKCMLKFGSWSLNTDRINLVLARDKIDAGYYVPHHDWELGRTKAEKSTKEYPCCRGEYFSDITYTIAFSLRQPQPDESDQDIDGALCPRISFLMVLTSALVLLFV